MKILNWKFGIWSFKKTWKFELEVLSLIHSKKISPFLFLKIWFILFYFLFFSFYDVILIFFLGMEKKRKWKENNFFFWELTQQLSCNFNVGAEFWPPIHLISLFSFFASSFITFSSSINTIHLLLPLDFSSSCHHFFYIKKKKKNTFLSFSTFPHPFPSIFLLILVFLSTFTTHPFLVEPVRF